MKSGLISKELMGMLGNFLSGIPEAEHDRFIKHVEDFMRPIMQPDAGDMFAARDWALKHIHMPEWLKTANQRRKFSRKREQLRKQAEQDQREREISFGYEPMYGREAARTQWERKHSRKIREYDDA